MQAHLKSLFLYSRRPPSNVKACYICCVDTMIGFICIKLFFILFYLLFILNLFLLYVIKATTTTTVLTVNLR